MPVIAIFWQLFDKFWNFNEQFMEILQLIEKITKMSRKIGINAIVLFYV